MKDFWSDYVTKLKRFLTAAWEDGMLIGKTPEESFFVKCYIKKIENNITKPNTEPIME
jgi:hypothetical protein